MRLTFAFSPCPNDTFMFEALVHRRIDMPDLEFETALHDVEQLNKAAQEETYDVTKLSFNAYASLAEKYQLLQYGSALGRGCGPLLIAGRYMNPGEVSSARIAIPGFNTTAYFLLTHAYPEVSQCHEVVFSEVEDMVIRGKCDAGVIIHENRFTYQEKGLLKIADLGEIWENTTGHPIPLGAIAVKRSLSEKIKMRISKVIQSSINFAFQHPDTVMPYVRCHAQEMQDHVMKQHIQLYVNEDSRAISEAGKSAVHYLMQKKMTPDQYKNIAHRLFVDAP